jgi:hypothetical protein
MRSEATSAAEGTGASKTYQVFLVEAGQVDNTDVLVKET